MSHLAIGSINVRIVGIWGPGGMGKTTLARFVYEMVSDQFKACVFIRNVREVSKNIDDLLQLQKRLLNALLNESDVRIHDVGDGVLMIKKMLCHKKILLVLDDVNDLQQLEYLAREHGWFGPGSRVIITTRDKQLLRQVEVDGIYEVDGLNDDEALHLLSLNAFKKAHPPTDYLELSKDVVHYVKGLPLAIEILGSSLLSRSVNHWKSVLNRLKEFPECTILKKLKIGFDELNETERKMFLYIACFFNHEGKDSVVEKLNYLGLHPGDGLDILVDKSLVKMNAKEVWMHDLLQEMGKNIVHDECPEDPGKRSRLWSFEDINNVLTKNTGTEVIQGIVLKLSKPKVAHWIPESFSKVQDLELLIIDNVHLQHDPKYLPNGLRFLDWSGYPSKSFPSSFKTKSFDKLKFIKFNKSLKLIETSDFTDVPVLEKLVLEDCINLSRVHPLIGVHKMLKVLSLKGCKNLKSLPSKFEMESLEILILSGCSKVKKFPEFRGNMERVCQLYLDGTTITKLPASIENLTGLTSLKLKDCKNLVCLPSTIFNLKLLKDVDISGCSKVERLPENLGNAESVEELDVSGTALRHVPSFIGHLKNLRKLSFKGCKGLSSSNKSWNELIPFYSKPISPNPVGLSHLSGLCSLTELNLRDCNLEAIPNDIGSLFSLKRLYLSENKFVCLPESLGQLTKLEKLDLHVNDLVSLPESIGQLTKLVELDLGANDFVSLPESIGQLSELTRMKVTNCRYLKSLPKLPLNIVSIEAEGCESLEMIADRLWQNAVAKILLENCFKLSENQGIIDYFIAFIKIHLQHQRFQDPKIIIPGSEIPEWFSHQSMEPEVNIKLHYSHLCNDFMGFAFCVVTSSERLLSWSFMVNGKEIYYSCCGMDHINIASDHILLACCCTEDFRDRFSKSLVENDANGLCQIGIRFEIDRWIKGLTISGKEVKKCGVRLLYKKDIQDHIPDFDFDFDSDSDSDSDSDRFSKSLLENYANGFCQIQIGIRFEIDRWIPVLTISGKEVKKCGGRLLYKKDIEDHIPTDSDSDSDSDSTLVTEGNKVKRRCDEYDGAGPSGEGSSNDVPHPKRIERPTEFGNSDSEESSEYKDCDEELSDVQ